MKNEMVIGVLGGMGTYATVHMFKQYADIFAAEKEWDRPRIIIDNRCTMPSSVRAYLYNEKIEELVFQMTDSIERMIAAGCTRIILACNTSHLFLPYIFEKLPQAKDIVVDIIETCVDEICNNNVKEVFLLGSEGTIESRIYQKKLIDKAIQCIVPQKEEYGLLRNCIESVKQNNIEVGKDSFINLVNRYNTCILGCTELPVLYEIYKNEITCMDVYDPLTITIKKIKKEYVNG